MFQAACTECGTKVFKLDLTRSGMCFDCDDKRRATEATGTSDLVAAEAAREKQINAIILTTETAGIAIEKRLGIVTAECAFGMNAFRDLAASARNIFGGRSEAVQQTMRQSRETVLRELRVEAHALGANAVVAVDLDYSEIGSGGQQMMLVVASGTAVIMALPGEMVERA